MSPAETLADPLVLLDSNWTSTSCQSHRVITKLNRDVDWFGGGGEWREGGGGLLRKGKLFCTVSVFVEF